MPVDIEERSILSHEMRHSTLFQDISIELLPEQVDAFLPKAKCFPENSLVFLTHIPGKPISAQAEAAKKIHNKGFVPVPHLAARNFTSADEYAGHLRTLASIGVTTVLVLGGNPSSGTPPLRFAADLLRHPVLNDVQLKKVFIAGHPEGHSVIPKDALIPALKEKISLVREWGAQPEIVTQFAFNGEAMAAWAAELRTQDINAPLRFGMAGVTSLPKLIKFAAMCGVGASLNALKRQGTSLIKAMRDQDPGDIIAELDSSLSQRGIKDVTLHFFPFGGWEKTLKWIDMQSTE
ncbi:MULTISPECIES: methylenetetrahydrofolate reductase [Filomicrobium]|nr:MULTISPECIES: methylenetetrahydrofolate reductase [Filomicrobium]